MINPQEMTGLQESSINSFWNDIENSLSDSTRKSIISGEQSTSQKQAVLELI